MRTILFWIEYLVFCCTERKHYQWTLVYKYTLGHGYIQNILRLFRRFQDKDQRIFLTRKLCFLDNHYLIHIQVYIPCRDHHGIRANKYKYQHYIESSDHMGKDCMDHLSRVRLKNNSWIQFENSDLEHILGLGLRLQIVNASPMKPSEQEHIGVWLITLHKAFTPQDPGQGSLHFSLIQAKLLGHSELTVHSGLQFGGLPL